MTRRKAAAPAAGWKVIAFGDLHMSTSTMERALDVLRRIRALAKKHEALVVCLGDFWDARGVLSVRQIDALFDEFNQWQADGVKAVFVPGNHDQVSVNGLIHGVRIFEPFESFSIATKPLLDHANKMAFIPWREIPEEQAAQFELVGDDWTIFTHAEVGGAVGNGGHRASGRVQTSQIEKVARACYVGHYHKRQKIGDRTWYIGSPFEMDFGEMGDPKGVALIDSTKVDPTFINFEDFPRHVRMVLGADFTPRPQDIVELYAPSEKLGSDEVKAYRDKLVSADVRVLPQQAAPDAQQQAPVIALSLSEAIDTYAGNGSTVHDHSKEEIVRAAHEVLKELPEVTRPTPFSPVVMAKRVRIKDFCALKGEISIDLDAKGLMLLRGPVGSGKTALIDAVTWCLFGETSPRKAGAATATFRADEIINDYATSTEVEVELAFADGSTAVVTREKKKGSGARVTVKGLDPSNPMFTDGVLDHQKIVDRLIGLDYDLWRACVSLGQGATANFVTDADKKRKEILSSAFGLDVCPIAVKALREKIKPLASLEERLRMEITGEESSVRTLRETDFTAQSQQWAANRELTLAAAIAAGEEAKKKIASCDEALAGEAAWNESKATYEHHVDTLTKRLGALSTNARSVELQRDLGSARAERAMAEKQHGLMKSEIAKLTAEFEAKASMNCPTCGQSMVAAHAEKHIAERTHALGGFLTSMQQFDARISNANVALGELAAASQTERQSIEDDLKSARENLSKVHEALAAFARIRHNKQEAERSVTAARETWARENKSLNPFEAQQKLIESRIEALEAALVGKQTKLLDTQRDLSLLRLWEEGFGPKGLPVLVLRTVLHELEVHANRFLAKILKGRIQVALVIEKEDLRIDLFERDKLGTVRQRRYEQLSGGQRRCVELAFAPFALSEMIFARTGVRVPLLFVDELTTHLGVDEKPLVCNVLRELDRETIIVIDHDLSVQGEFDVVLDVVHGDAGVRLERIVT